MNIPTPAAVKKQADARKEREAELASSLASAKDKMPPTKGASKSSGTRPSDRSASSTKGKGSRDRSSNSSIAQKSSSPSFTRSKKETTSSRSDGSANASGSRTPRKKSSTKPSGDTTKSTPEAKKPFVRPEHLTTRPLRNNEALLGLKKSLEKPARGQFKREYRVGGRRNGKSQGLNSKKENS